MYFKARRARLTIQQPPPLPSGWCASQKPTTVDVLHVLLALKERKRERQMAPPHPNRSQSPIHSSPAPCSAVARCFSRRSAVSRGCGRGSGTLFCLVLLGFVLVVQCLISLISDFIISLSIPPPAPTTTTQHTAHLVAALAQGGEQRHRPGQRRPLAARRHVAHLERGAR